MFLPCECRETYFQRRLSTQMKHTKEKGEEQISILIRKIGGCGTPYLPSTLILDFHILLSNDYFLDKLQVRHVQSNSEAYQKSRRALIITIPIRKW